jgi:hypothetical protein
MTRTMGILCEDLCTFMIVSCLILPRMRNVSETNCRGNKNTHFMFSNVFPKNHAICEMMSKNMVEPDRPHRYTQKGEDQLEGPVEGG